MNKVVIAIVGSILAISIIVIVSSIQNNQKSTEQQKKSLSSYVAPIPQPSLNTYTDPSGFIFQYPTSLTVFPATPLTNSYYANVEATASGKPGKATLIIESTIVKSIADFKRSNSQIPKITIQTKLADLDAIEFDNDKTHTTMAIDQGTLITIITPLADKSFWDPIHKSIVSTFKFSQPSVAPASTRSSDGGGGGDDMIFEGEEVVE